MTHLLNAIAVALVLLCAPLTVHAVSIRTVVLPPVIFDDIPIDRYEQRLAADAFFESARRELQQKGYEVVSATDEVTRTSLRQAARSLTTDCDALAVIRIDHYLDAGFNEDSRNPSYLEVYASVQIHRTGSGDLLWEGEGHGTSSRGTGGVSSTRLELSLAADEVMREMFLSLPAAGNWTSP